MLRQQPRPERRAGVSPASKPAEYDNTFAGLSLFRLAVRRLELLDVSCTVAQGAAWKKIHSIIDIYCIPHCTKCQPSGVYKWFQELILLYHSENQVLVTCCVAPTDRISMTNLQDRLGHLATLRSALDSDEHTREHLVNLITSERLLGQLSPVKGAQRFSQSTVDVSPEYDHPSKKTKPGTRVPNQRRK